MTFSGICFYRILVCSLPSVFNSALLYSSVSEAYPTMSEEIGIFYTYIHINICQNQKSCSVKLDPSNQASHRLFNLKSVCPFTVKICQDVPASLVIRMRFGLL